MASDIVDFILQDLTIEVGTRVIWANRDISSHTSTSGTPGNITGLFDRRTLSTDRSFSFTFNQAGTFPYFCKIHPFMQATVTVVESLPGGPIVSTPTPPPTPTPTPTPEGIIEKPTVQEVAIIENYAATRFFPREIVVIKGIPVKLYLTRLHREHVNRFTIDPFFSSSEVILPGEVGLIEFLPDQLGKFRIRNVGHGFEATLVVVETMEEARQYFVDKGVKMLALIHSLDDSRIFPEQSFVVKDVPVRVFNISLTADYKVSIAPFYVAEDVNVRPREIASFDFTPDSTGEFTIRDETQGFMGTLTVEEGR
ncbi:MAG: plastocyanin/azurin family copper-binding protein [Dehalococcoidia bacterium]